MLVPLVLRKKIPREITSRASRSAGASRRSTSRKIFGSAGLGGRRVPPLIMMIMRRGTKFLENSWDVVGARPQRITPFRDSEHSFYITNIYTKVCSLLRFVDIAFPTCRLREPTIFRRVSYWSTNAETSNSVTYLILYALQATQFLNYRILLNRALAGRSRSTAFARGAPCVSSFCWKQVSVQFASFWINSDLELFKLNLHSLLIICS